MKSLKAKNMPGNWTPPAPGWRPSWYGYEGAIVVAYFGVQAGRDLLASWAQLAFEGEDGPGALEQGVFVDTAGVTNHLYVSYWREVDYQKWWCHHQHWWQSHERIDEEIGLWREVFTMPQEFFESLLSTATVHGAAALSEGLEGPVSEHGYAGSMRDRISASENDDLKGKGGALEAKVADEGRRLLFRLPKNICMIRSGQDWSECDKQQKSDYLQNLHPVLHTGMDYLRDNGDECGCLSMRLICKTNSNWEPIEETFGLGYALDVYAFEEWAKSHPTHLAIFGGFMSMVERYGESLSLQLWHEVAVCNGEGSEFEYINCHSGTGILMNMKI